MFDPIKVTQDIKELFARFEAWEKGVASDMEVRLQELEKRVGELEGHVVVAGVGATQAEGVTIPAEEIGQYQGQPNSDKPTPETVAEQAPGGA